MTLENQKKYRDALTMAKAEFSKRSFAKVLELSGATPYDDSSLILPYGGEFYRVWHPAGHVRPWDEDKVMEQEGEVEITDHILILHYLNEVCGVQPTGRWVSYRELPGGNNHYGTFKLEAMDPLAKQWGASPEKFAEVCERLGGKKLALGDIAYGIRVLPKIEVAFILWLADEEFPAQANILYDATASMHLNTEGLEVIGINIVKKMIDMAQEEST